MPVVRENTAIVSHLMRRESRTEKRIKDQHEKSLIKVHSVLGSSGGVLGVAQLLLKGIDIDKSILKLFIYSCCSLGYSRVKRKQ